MDIDVAQTLPGKMTRVDEGEHLVVGGNGSLGESTQPLMTVPQVACPDRGIDQDHWPSRLLGTGASCFSVPPSLARRFALSRAITSCV